jgi:hypothetical protein
MKKFLLITICLMAMFYTEAQQVKTKDVKQGTVIQMEALAQGQIYPMVLTVATATEDELVFAFDVMGSLTGKFINGKGNFEKGVRFNWDEPFAGEERKVPDDQTLLVISRTALKDLKSNKKCSFNDQVLVQKELPAADTISLNGVEVDIIYAESEDGSTKYWILNNDLFPILMKLSGNPGGIDLQVKDFK